jgi:hypothetical protein
MYQLINFNDTYYQLVRKIKVDQVNGNMEGLKAWRDQLHCDHVLRHNDYFLMVRFVDEISWETVA